MSDRPRENPEVSPPRDADAADARAAMRSVPHGPRYRPSDLNDARTADEALLHWDELDRELLSLLAADPARAEKLSLLRRADDELRRGSAGAAQECPDSADLYDFANGPGAAQLAPERVAAIDRHLAACRDCEQLVATLATAPPPPLILGEEPVLERVAPVVRPLPAPRRAVRWGWIAAAAVFLGVLGSLPALLERGPRWPEAPLLRGEAAGALLFPRDRVVAREAAIVAAWPALGGAVRFEIAPQKDAGEYRVEIRRHSGGAFERGDVLATWSSSEPAFERALDLPAGHYTWEAWALVNGLETPLGARDFAVEARGGAHDALEKLAASPEEHRTLAALERLHELGFLTDARALARSLPPSPERDAYLARAPGR